MWWDDANAFKRSSYLQNLRYDLVDTLKRIGYDDAVIRKRGELGIVKDRISCDYYDFIAGVPAGINAYHGEYMSQYSWSEVTHASLEFME